MVVKLVRNINACVLFRHLAVVKISIRAYKKGLTEISLVKIFLSITDGSELVQMVFHDPSSALDFIMETFVPILLAMTDIESKCSCRGSTAYNVRIQPQLYYS